MVMKTKKASTRRKSHLTLNGTVRREWPQMPSKRKRVHVDRPKKAKCKNYKCLRPRKGETRAPRYSTLNEASPGANGSKLIILLLQYNECRTRTLKKTKPVMPLRHSWPCHLKNELQHTISPSDAQHLPSITTGALPLHHEQNGTAPLSQQRASKTKTKSQCGGQHTMGIMIT